MDAKEYIKHLMGGSLLGKKITFSWLSDSVLVLLLDDETENSAARLEIKSTGEIRLEDANGVGVFKLKPSTNSL